MIRIPAALPVGEDGSQREAHQAKQPASAYIKRMYTDTVFSSGRDQIRYRIYGVDRVMYGTDYPCLDQHKTLDLFNEIALAEEDRKKILYETSALFNLRDRSLSRWQSVRRRPACHGEFRKRVQSRHDRHRNRFVRRQNSAMLRPSAGVVQWQNGSFPKLHTRFDLSPAQHFSFRSTVGASMMRALGVLLFVVFSCASALAQT